MATRSKAARTQQHRRDPDRKRKPKVLRNGEGLALIANERARKLIAAGTLDHKDTAALMERIHLLEGVQMELALSDRPRRHSAVRLAAARGALEDLRGRLGGDGDDPIRDHEAWVAASRSREPQGS